MEDGRHVECMFDTKFIGFGENQSDQNNQCQGPHNHCFYVCFE